MSLKSLTCEDVNPLLDAYRDQELDQFERQAVAAHLDSCQNCQTKLKGIESVVSSLKSLPQLQMPHDLTADMDFLKTAFELAGCRVDSAVETTAKAESSTDTIKAFPIAEESSKHRLLHRIFPSLVRLFLPVQPQLLLWPWLFWCLACSIHLSLVPPILRLCLNNRRQRLTSTTGKSMTRPLTSAVTTELNAAQRRVSTNL